MSPTENGPKTPPMRLLPHQAAFVETYFSPASKRIILLRADVGLGKSAALVALASRLLQERPTARVLLLAHHAALRSQFMQILSAANIRSLLVDRYRFREMLDSTAEGEFWPRGLVAIASLDFVKLPDIRKSLAAIRWDLVIVDEAHSLKGARAEALRRVGASAERVVLATASDLAPTVVFPGEVATTVEWRRNQIVNHDGTLLVTMPRPLLHEVAFSLSPAELSLLKTVGDLCRIWEAGTAHRDVIANSLLRSFQSSPAALEHILTRLAGGLALNDLDAPLEVPEEELPEGGPDVQMNQNIEEQIAGIAKRALQEIEVVGGDSKLRTFGGLLAQLNEVEMPSRRICVLTEYLSTLYYLAAEIEDQGMVCQLLHGGMPIEERQEALTRFSSTGAILTATRAVMVEGIDLSEVTDLVLYDMPSSKVALQLVLDRFGRRGELNVHVLTPSNVAHGPAPEPLGFLHELFGFSNKVQPTQ